MQPDASIYLDYLVLSLDEVDKSDIKEHRLFILKMMYLFGNLTEIVGGTFAFETVGNQLVSSLADILYLGLRASDNDVILKCLRVIGNLALDKVYAGEMANHSKIVEGLLRVDEKRLGSSVEEIIGGVIHNLSSYDSRTMLCW